MSKATLFLTLFCPLFLVQGLSAQGRYSDVMSNIGDANYGTFDEGNPIWAQRLMPTLIPLR